MAIASGGCGSERRQQPETIATPRGRAVELAAETVRVGGAPWGVAVAGDRVLVGDATRGVVLQIDAASRQVLGEIATGDAGPSRRRVAFADGELWIANLGGSVGVVDLATGQPTARVAIGAGEPAAVVLDDRWAWVPTHGPGGGLVRLDRADPQRDPLILTLPESALAVAMGDGTVWVAGLGRRAFAVDAATGSVVRTIGAGAAPRGIAVAVSDVWVSLRDERAVIRIDPATGDETGRIDTGG